jgi:hypothetical protein
MLPKTLTGGGLRNEALDGLSAGGRNLAGIGDKASADTLAVWDELGADRQRVCHARPFVGWGFGVLGLGLLGLRSDGGGSERHAEGHEPNRKAGFHETSERIGPATSQVKQRVS